MAETSFLQIISIKNSVLFTNISIRLSLYDETTPTRTELIMLIKLLIFLYLGTVLIKKIPVFNFDYKF